MILKKFIQQTYRDIVEDEKLPQFLILISFLTAFVLIRIITYLQRINVLPNQMGKVHIHHLVPGIFLLLISGYIGISYWSNERMRRITAIAFGIGAALTIDEFALWLFLQDVYFTKEGRLSVDAVIVVAVLLLIGFLIADVKSGKESV